MSWTETTQAQYMRSFGVAHAEYETDVTDAEWALVEGFLPPPSKIGRPRKTDLRAVFNAIQKLRRNEPLTKQDLEELERVFVKAGATEQTDLEKLRKGGGLGVFVRSLVGLDREAAKRVFDSFQATRTLSASQIEFLNMMIDYLTERGVMDPRLLYESPFTDLDAMGVEGVFESANVVELVGILEDLRERAVA